jgi:nicotinate-nucleotide adenylyltransferase
MERIGIYGGTFNPPHIGHIRAAAYAVKELQLDRLLVIPSRISPHKQLPKDSPTPQQRLEMLKIATAGLENMEVSDLELNREGTSYTYQTVQQVRRMYPDAKIFLLMGTDMFLSFHSWRNPELITKDAALAVFYRGDKNEVDAIKSRVAEVSWEVELIENPIIDISSTQLRRMLVFGCADSFLPNGVGDYIRSHGFYGTDECYKDLPMEELEKVVVSLLDPKRVAHVLGCRDTAVELAKIWGTDETDAARAGLLHDITKALDGPLQLTLSDAYGTILDKFGKDHPKTLHALTGSLVAQRIFGENEAVVSAIRSHTTGKAGMNTLEKIIYVADYMEPNRDFPGVNKLRHLAKTDLDGAMKLGLEMTLAHLARQGSSVSPESLEALAYFE